MLVVEAVEYTLAVPVALPAVAPAAELPGSAAPAVAVLVVVEAG